jgi:CDP-2,3-bis-(O-geranylgeranyl)-sn-glycerol synthase
MRDGHRILGDGKTIRGFISGVFFGSLTALGQFILAPYLMPLLAEYVTVTPTMEYVLFMTVPAGFLLSFGALAGDLTGSFLKRRVNVQSGGPSLVLDQLGFIIMALIFAYPILRPEGIYVVILIITTLGIHWVSNALGYLLGFKKNPW